MSSTDVRRAQLIAPFGTGAMLVMREGLSVVTAGLDGWFGSFDESEFKIRDARLEELLDVDHFRLPPPFRTKQDMPNADQQEAKKLYLEIPAYRFPQYHQCTRCGVLRRVDLLDADRRIECQHCAPAEGKKRRPHCVQVRFVVACSRGHMHDFPWVEWAHQDASSRCLGPVKVTDSGSGALAAIRVTCTACGKAQSLRGEIMDPNRSQESALGLVMRCRGEMPWHGPGCSETCGEQLTAMLRSSTSLYFADTRSSILLPRGSTPAALVDLLNKNEISVRISMAIGLGVSRSQVAPMLRQHHPVEFRSWSDEQIEEALNTATTSDANSDSSEDLRRDEYSLLRTEDLTDGELIRRRVTPTGVVAAMLDRVVLVERLTETRALVGFTRTKAGQVSKDRSTRLMWGSQQNAERWLPAIQVRGEGLYLELKADRVAEWETKYSDLLTARISQMQESSGMVSNEAIDLANGVSPRFVLVHTLAHLLINRLVYECGYGSASLRERLYVSEEGDDDPMAALLIYTAAGDSEGTMGGLVRMGSPDRLVPLVERALAQAAWCSTDPVCMEAARSGGQGPASCNGAACHDCALLPETSCEMMNSYLDRGVVTGDPTREDQKGLGFLEALLVEGVAS